MAHIVKRLLIQAKKNRKTETSLLSYLKWAPKRSIIDRQSIGNPPKGQQQIRELTQGELADVGVGGPKEHNLRASVFTCTAIRAGAAMFRVIKGDSKCYETFCRKVTAC